MASFNYGCSQADLYSACRIAWKLCQKNLTTFAAFSPQYTEGFITQHLAAVEAADFMPDLAARKAKSKSARIDLIDAKDELTYQYGLLTAYIKKTFDASKVELMLEASGDKYLEKTKAGNWSNAASLISSSVPFLDEYAAVLTDKNIMPPTFVATYKATTAAFMEKYAASQNADESATLEGDAKGIANQNIYAAVKTMFEDAQNIFRKDVATAKQFVWSTVVAQTHGVKNAGINGKITQEGGKNGIANIKVTAVGTDKTTMSDSEGRYDLSPLSSGTYAFSFSGHGFETKVIDNIVINTGVTARQNVSLTPQTVLLITA